jgi:hypothetical protein
VKRSLVLVGALVAAIALAGGAAGSGTERAKPDARDRALLASILSGMTTDLQDVRLTQLPAKGWCCVKDQLMLQASVGSKPDPPERMFDAWYSTLIAGAYNDLCKREADHCVAAYRTPRVGRSWFGNPGGNGARPPYTGPQTLTRKIRAAFARVGIHGVLVGFEHPSALAPVITAQTRHVQRTANAVLRLFPRLPSRHVAGRIVKVLDAHGRTVFVESHSAGTTMVWADPTIRLPQPVHY